MLNRLLPHRGRRPERGFSLVLTALLLAALMGIAGLVVDLGSWQVEASRIQQAADAASLAAVVRLPDGEAAVTARAVEIARDNGFDDADPEVTVSVRVLGGETVEVTVTKTGVAQYFTTVVRGDNPPTITRRSTAQYVQPVPLGSPRNYLGTNQLLASGPNPTSGDGIENFYLAVSGECTRREYGDRVTGIAMNNQSAPTHSCDPGVGGTLANPEATTKGYLFTVTVPATAGSTPVAIQMFDAPTCTNDGAAVRIFGEQLTPHPTTVTVRRFDDLDPLAGSEADVGAPGYIPSPIPTPRTFEGQSATTGQCRFGLVNSSDLTCGPEVPLLSGLRECWTTVALLTTPGQYTIQVDPVAPAPARNQNTRHNVFSLRAKTGTTFAPCTSDLAVRDGLLPATPPYSSACTQISGLEHLPIYARGNNSPIFYLASIDARHNGKTMQVTLYDAAEGASTISLLNPLGGTEQFTWEVLCANGATPSGGCPGEAGPTGGRTGGPTASISVAGTGTQPFANNIQNGKYSDRLLRLTLKMPNNIATAYGGRTWWKIQYGGAFTGDRTTWSVRLLGDPVRLIPNTPTTTIAGP